MYKKVLQIGSIIIMLFLIIYLGTLVDWIFKPLVVFVQTLFIPILFAGILYYLLRPLVRVLSHKLPRALAIVTIYIALIGVLVSLGSLIGPELQRQFSNFISSMPSIVKELQLLIAQTQENESVQRIGLGDLLNWQDQIEQLGAVLGGVIGELATNIMGFIGTVFNTLLLFIIIPFILFYLLKEGEKLPNYLLKFVSKEKQGEIKPILTNLDQTLSRYIQGVLLVCLFIGLLYYIGFVSIGLEFALILAIFGMVTNVIPYVGPWIGAIPSVIVALLHSPMQAVLVLIIVVVIQQIESIFVQPQVIGRTMSIHPVTVMILVLVAGRFIGIVGMVLAIPTYAVVKVIATHFYRLWKVRSSGNEEVNG
ncbi:AI-2E family transporter [Bacillus sp. JCM 19034]|uniref:AI-2E family transporter n=1 Tax=Bacillus sp. JCM 19034 TaxID=1481928 RepID=UPI0007848FB4|nr:AI-2E family transporter [Bacillus sp. JCM 19034]